MANNSDARPRSSIPLSALGGAIKKLERRGKELDQTSLELPVQTDFTALYSRIVTDINATVDYVFRVGTPDARDFSVDKKWFYSIYADGHDAHLKNFKRGHARAKDCLLSAIKRLKEKQEDADDDTSAKTLRAYEGLELHPEIAHAASDLYRNGHYANAIEDAVKALNGLVRLRSGIEGDGITLMQAAFSPKSPVLSFNDLKDQNDQNEQTGFMMMFAGAVAGLRNPRAHSLIKDDAERHWNLLLM